MPLCKTCKSTYKAKFLENGICKLCIVETNIGVLKVCKGCSVAILDGTYCVTCAVKVKKEEDKKLPKYLCKAGCGAPLYSPGTCGACVQAKADKLLAEAKAQQAAKDAAVKAKTICPQCQEFKYAHQTTCHTCQKKTAHAAAAAYKKQAVCSHCGGFKTPLDPHPLCNKCKKLAYDLADPLSPVESTSLEKVKAAKLEQQKAKKAQMQAMLGALPQKVKGLKVLPEAYPSSKTLDALIFTSTEAIQTSSSNMWNHVDPLFLRPCPPIPCHGFVDSRPTKTSNASARKLEAVSLLETVLSKVPGSALMVCRYISSRRNAIVTPHAIVFGDGHDGATMGKNTITIPLNAGNSPIREELGWKAGIADGESPYVEVVFPENASWESPFDFTMTQLRSGPSVGGKDNVLAAMVVGEIYDCNPETEDAEGWPSKLDAMKHPGLLVFQEGGSVGCHYGANCALKGVSYMSSRRPKVGETLPATKDTPPTPPSKSAFETGYINALETPLDNKDAYARAVSFLLAATHSIVALSEGAATKYIGAACAFMIRLGTAASLGEMRHTHHGGYKGAGKSKKGRQQIFRSVLNEKGSTIPKYLVHRRKLVGAQVCFSRDGWHGGFGGAKWGECALATLQLDSTIMDYLRGRKSAGGFADVGVALHNAVNKAHNNGWWLNKFSTQGFFDGAAAGSLDVTLHGLPFFDVFSRALKPVASKVKKLCEADSCLVYMPTTLPRERAIGVAQYCWIDSNKTRVHVQFKYTGIPTEAPYDRHDFVVTGEQRDLLLSYEASQSEQAPSWNSGDRKYYPLEIFPGSTVAGVTLAGIFRPIVTLKGQQL